MPSAESCLSAPVYRTSAFCALADDRRLATIGCLRPRTVAGAANNDGGYATHSGRIWMLDCDFIRQPEPHFAFDQRGVLRERVQLSLCPACPQRPEFSSHRSPKRPPAALATPVSTFVQP